MGEHGEGREGDHLEAREQGLRERVKSAPLHLSFVKVELAPEQLHAQQGEDDEKEEEQEQQGADGFHGVEQRVDQVRQSSPVPGNDNKQREEVRMRRCGSIPSSSPAKLHRPSHLEDPEQSDAAQHGDAYGRDEVQLHEQRLQDAAAHHEAVEAIKQGHEVDLQAKGVHLHQHLQGEEQQQDLVGSLWGHGHESFPQSFLRSNSESKSEEGFSPCISVSHLGWP